MISQADIIRTLVNKNCTDESVLSTALSPDCTPPKLLEKLTEAERFDLALDLSMKLGLDVIPLWRTWAMRCLQNRNFQGARDKFRHCFLRLRLPGGRTSSMQSRLLDDILKQLASMDESQMSLIEEIEMIKVQKYIPCSSGAHDDSSTPVSSKPKIYAECIYYLNEYGNLEDLIKFNIKNYLWKDAITILMEKANQINMDKFFIPEVVMYLTSTGRLGDLITTFLEFDPDIVCSALYFKAIYGFCMRNRRYNLLYYVQTSIHDHIAAATTQINHFFLKRPIQSYRDLNQRVTNLISARTNYQDYLNRSKTIGSDTVETKSSLITYMLREEVEEMLKKIDLQIDITRNFAINEVSGCITGLNIELASHLKIADENNDCPVTIFDKGEVRKVFLAALVLIYFDSSCKAYFTKDGLDIANRIVDDCKLDKLRVFKTAMRIIMEDESCDILENANLLLERLKEDYLVNQGVGYLKQVKVDDEVTPLGRNSHSNKNRMTNSDSNNQTGLVISASEQVKSICDEVIRDAIGSCREPDYKMELAKLLSGEAKIELYIELGKLSNAQILACTMNRPDYVSNIIEEASKLNQNHVKTVCQLWLAKHETRNFIR